MINWKLSLIHLAELIKHDFHKELLAYLIIQLFEYCLILSYLNVTVSTEISKYSITIKYIHNYVNDTSLYSTITSFTVRRNDLCHKPLTEITYKYLIELITNDKFLVLLKRVVPDDLYTELEETFSIVRSKINSCNKDINEIFSCYRRKYNIQDGTAWINDYIMLSKIVNSKDEKEIARYIKDNLI